MRFATLVVRILSSLMVLVGLSACGNYDVREAKQLDVQQVVGVFNTAGLNPDPVTFIYKKSSIPVHYDELGHSLVVIQTSQLINGVKPAVDVSLDSFDDNAPELQGQMMVMEAPSNGDALLVMPFGKKDNNTKVITDIAFMINEYLDGKILSQEFSEKTAIDLLAKSGPSGIQESLSALPPQDMVAVVIFVNKEEKFEMAQLVFLKDGFTPNWDGNGKILMFKNDPQKIPDLQVKIAKMNLQHFGAVSVTR